MGPSSSAVLFWQKLVNQIGLYFLALQWKGRRWTHRSCRSRKRPSPWGGRRCPCKWTGGISCACSLVKMQWIWYSGKELVSEYLYIVHFGRVFVFESVDLNRYLFLWISAALSHCPAYSMAKRAQSVGIGAACAIPQMEWWAAFPGGEAVGHCWIPSYCV